MYNHFYGFTEHPFDITPDPRFLYLTEAHVEALASLFYAIRQKKGFVCVTGEVGTGKTTVLYHLIDRLPDWVETAFIYHTNITFDQLLKNILLELNVPVDGGEKYMLVHRLNKYLLERLKHDQTVALIIDEAQNLPAETLEELRMLTNLETRKEKLLQIVLVGQPELDTKLDSVELRQLRQRVVVRRQLKPLTPEESVGYINHRLSTVGRSSSKVFTPEAVSLVCSHAQGIPRLINVTCDNALMIGYGKGQKKIGVDIIREVILQMASPAPQSEAVPLPKVVSAVAPDVSAAPEPRNNNGQKEAVLKKLLSVVSQRLRKTTRDFIADCEASCKDNSG